MSLILNNICGIIEEYCMSHMAVKIITWFIWCQFSHPQAGVCTDQPWHTQPGPGRPPPANIGPDRARLLKLVRALHCLLNLVWGGCLIIDRPGSGAALVHDGRGRGRYRRACLDSHVRCGRGHDRHGRELRQSRGCQ